MWVSAGPSMSSKMVEREGSLGSTTFPFSSKVTPALVVMVMPPFSRSPFSW